jgi:hypothetical protein
MKIKEEQKEVIKAVSSKMASKFADDIRSTKASSMTRPLVILVLVLAGVAVIRDPMSLFIGIIAALLVALAMSTTAEDVHKLTSSLKKDEKPAPVPMKEKE